MLIGASHDHGRASEEKARARRPDVFSDDARSLSMSTPEKLVSASDDVRRNVQSVWCDIATVKAGTQWIRCRRHLHPHCEGCQSRATCVSRESTQSLGPLCRVQLIAATAWLTRIMICISENPGRGHGRLQVYRFTS